uniref:NAD(P)-binding domain-containing protein n=1 Tax=Lygus hesperus TaxID=30085 RepID=A0A0A9YP15_LYGHE
MKQALVLSGNSYAGRHIVQRFVMSGEYDVRITIGRETTAYHNPANTASITPVEAVEESKQKREETTLQSYQDVQSIEPRYAKDVRGFQHSVLAADVIVAVVNDDDDCAEAHAAVKVLAHTHTNVEKTFVLLSSCMTWAETIRHARNALRRRRVDEAQVAIESFRDEYGDDEELPV